MNALYEQNVSRANSCVHINVKGENNVLVFLYADVEVDTDVNDVTTDMLQLVTTNKAERTAQWLLFGQC